MSEVINAVGKNKVRKKNAGCGRMNNGILNTMTREGITEMMTFE